MTVEENLEMGAFTQSPAGVPADLAHVFELFPRLQERRRQVAGTLSGGEQQMLAMGRALMSHPKLLMLDEPSMGLAPILVEQIFEIIRALHKTGTTILLVEQNAQMALSVADRAYVLETAGLLFPAPEKSLPRAMRSARHISAAECCHAVLSAYGQDGFFAGKHHRMCRPFQRAFILTGKYPGSAAGNCWIRNVERSY